MGINGFVFIRNVYASEILNCFAVDFFTSCCLDIGDLIWNISILGCSYLAGTIIVPLVWLSFYFSDVGVRFICFLQAL